MKRSNQGCLKLANQGCLLPLLRRRVNGKGQPRRINGDDEDDDVAVTQNIVSTPTEQQSECDAHHSRPKPPRRIDFKQETVATDTDSARLSLAKLYAVLRDAYVCTMMSFATKGGLGAVTMGGNINLPSAVPATSVKPAIISS